MEYCPKKSLDSLKCIVIFTDVISSGSTIHKVIEKIKEANSRITFHLISVISNNRELRGDVLNQIETVGSFCLELKIPVIENDNLPDENILPPNIDFSLKSE